MVESTEQNEARNRTNTTQGSDANPRNPTDSILATCSEQGIELVQKPRTLYSSNALRSVVPVKDLGKSLKSITQYNLEVKESTGNSGKKRLSGLF